MSTNRQNLGLNRKERFFVDVKIGLQWESENIIFSSVEDALQFANTNFPQNKWRIVDNAENVHVSSSGLENLESDANEQLNRFQQVEKTRLYYESLKGRRNTFQIARPSQDQVRINPDVQWLNDFRRENRLQVENFPFDFFKPKKQKNEYEEVDWMKEGF